MRLMVSKNFFQKFPATLNQPTSQSAKLSISPAILAAPAVTTSASSKLAPMAKPLQSANFTLKELLADRAEVIFTGSFPLLERTTESPCLSSTRLCSKMDLSLSRVESSQAFLVGKLDVREERMQRSKAVFPQD